jgi:hypothetical protein
VNLVVQLDRSEYETGSDGNWTGARRYRVESDDRTYQITSPVLEDLGAVDSGDWETVVDFVDWSAQNFPAEKYALVLWNHGEGWRTRTADNVRAISLDDSTGNYISIVDGDLENLLLESNDLLGGRVDLLGMDACLMQTWEVASDAAGFVDTYVASQEVEGFDGWSYDTAMADLVANPDMSSGELGEAIAERFLQSGDATQSVIDLTKMRDLTESIDALAGELLATSNAQSVLEDAGRASWSSSYNPDNHDRGMVLDEIANHEDATDAVIDASLLVRERLDATVVSNQTASWGYTSLSGMSIYLPTDSWVDSSYQRGSWAEATRWGEVVDSLR